MKNLLLFLFASITYSAHTVSDILNARGTIDDETQFTLYFDTTIFKFGNTFGSVTLIKKEKNCEQKTYPIQSFCTTGTHPDLLQNNITLKTEIGDFFIPRWRSELKPLFNQKPIILIRAEDVYAIAYPEALK